jgi:AAA domain
MIPLTDEQQGFVDSPRHSFVRACPGAGKTEAIAQRVRWLAGLLPPRKGLAVLSFSNSAIDEIVAKCRALECTQVSHHPSFVGTFDAFLRHFFLMPFGLLDVAVRPTVVDSWKNMGVEIRLGGVRAFRGGEGVPLDDFDPLTNAIDPATIGHNGLRAHVLAHRADYVAVATRRRAGLRNSGYVSAADVRAEVLARLADEAWANAVARALRGRFSEIIVDEAQDCNPLDVRLLRYLRDAGLAVCIVADPDQSIYGATPPTSTRLLRRIPRTISGPSRETSAAAPRSVVSRRRYAAALPRMNPSGIPRRRGPGASPEVRRRAAEPVHSCVFQPARRGGRHSAGHADASRTRAIRRSASLRHGL